jgi:hypothetical protein
MQAKCDANKFVDCGNNSSSHLLVVARVVQLDEVGGADAGGGGKHQTLRVVRHVRRAAVQRELQHP